jgi:hypothetical protein
LKFKPAAAYLTIYVVVRSLCFKSWRTDRLSGLKFSGFPHFLQANAGIKVELFWWTYMKILVKDEGADRCKTLMLELLIRSFWTKVSYVAALETFLSGFILV